jgi:hypothetical protein
VFEVWDRDHFSKDDSLGVASCPINQINGRRAFFRCYLQKVYTITYEP